MNTTRKHSLLWSAVVAISVANGAFAATPDAKPAGKEKDAPKPVEIPKAKFEYDNKKGKDPFFPKSVRWNPPPPKPVEVAVVNNNPNTPPPPPPPPKDPYKHFELKGMTGVGNARFVVINTGVKNKNYVLTLGDSKTVTTPDGNYKIKVEAFSDAGVVIKIDGEKASKEIKLPTGP